MVILALCLLSAAAARIFHLPMFYFGNDMVTSLLNGLELRDNGFRLNSDWMNSFGLPNPPMWSYVMGVFVTITENPLVMAGTLSVVGFAAILVTARHLTKLAPPEYAALAASALAVNCAFLLYGSMLWQPTLVITIALFYHVALGRFLRDKKPADFVWMAALAALASQFHLSGVLLFPAVGVALVVFRKDIGAKGAAQAAAALAVIMAPYAYTLFSSWEPGGVLSSISSKSGFSTDRARDLLNLVLAIGSPRVFQYWLGAGEFHRMIVSAVGGAGASGLIAAAYFLEACFVIGLLRYLWLAAKHRSPFPLEAASPGKTPIPFVGAGFTATVILAGLMLVRPPAFPHYALILLPSAALLAAWPLSRLWKAFAGKALVAACFLCAVTACWIFLATLKTSGGHPVVYGLTYESLVKIREQARQLVPDGRRADVSVSVLGARAYSSYIMGHVFAPLEDPALPGPAAPVRLVVMWNERTHSFEWAMTADKTGEGKQASLARARAMTGGRPAGAADGYQLVNVKFPFHLADRKELDALRVKLLDPAIGVVHNSDGVILFRSGAPKARDKELFEKIFLRFPAASSPSAGGWLEVSPASGNLIARAAAPGVTREGTFVIFGPYIKLAPGGYRAVFRINAGKPSGKTIAALEATADSGRTILGWKEITSADFPATNEWRKVAVPFTVPSGGADKVELRVQFLGGAPLRVDETRLLLDDAAFTATLAR